MRLKQPEFIYSACGPSQKAIKELRNSKKQGIQKIFAEMNVVKRVFDMV